MSPARRRRQPKPPSDPKPRESIGFRRRRLKRERALAFLSGQPLLVGIDLGKKRHAVWVAKSDQTPVHRFTSESTYDGLSKLLERVEDDRREGGHDRALFFMEATSYFWQSVANLLESRGLDYRLVSALSVDRQREIEHQTYAKGDYRDAELIVRLGQSGQWTEHRLEHDPIWLGLRTLAREHDVLLERRIAERLRTRSLLGLILPEFLEVFTDPLAKTASVLLRHLSSEPPPTTFAAVRERIGTVVGQRLARLKLRALAARLDLPLLGVERALATTLQRLSLALQRHDLLSEQAALVESRLVALYEACPYRAVLDTIPGVRSASHGLLLGNVGDPKRYDRATCLVKLAGTEPRENESGEGVGAHSISRRGQSPLRHLLYRVVSGLNLQNEDFRAYIKRIRTRDQNPLAWHQAVVAAGNKYLRVVHHMCVHGEVYRPSSLRP